ncbi:hypothetical protein C8F01DRAFT_750856 [Mycena amicta]|nr:hypothetical protein C8F01DRAFT_750856 [Mycena amicta]
MTDFDDADRRAALWQWTLTPEAVAPCFIRDVFTVRESGQKGNSEFYWLGRVPCRTMKIVGLIVGVQVYENRVVYSLDDGTGVIECQHRPSPQGRVANEELQPVVSLGDCAVVIGRIAPLRESRKIVVETIERCRSPNDEPRHWISVRDLHSTYYSLNEPFVIPERTQIPPPSTPHHQPTSLRPETPSTASSAPSSPTKSESVGRSPQKLRHPSRLRSRDLTANSFRIYMKHYMDNVADWQPLAEPTTPTKASSSRGFDEQTPRPPSKHAAPLSHPLRTAAAPAASSPPPSPYGFTISHLRRVPELALMAKNVAHAEWKRRALEEYNTAKANARGSERPPKPKPERDPQKRRARTKRLFVWAVQQLTKDGDVVSWEGPVRPASAVARAEESGSELWKMDYSSASSSTTPGGDSTLFSLASSSTAIEADAAEDELSDPQEGEEAYLPLTPAFLASTVERVIGTLMSRRTGTGGASLAKSPNTPEILRYLRRSDDMWRNLTEVAVGDALDLLRQQGRAWCVDTAEGRWELTV